MNPSRSLPAELTICTVGDAARDWQSWPAEEPERDALDVDASRVLDLDGAGVQLLISLANALRQRGRALRLMQPSGTLVAGCRRIGADFLLEPTPGPETAA